MYFFPSLITFTLLGTGTALVVVNKDPEAVSRACDAISQIHPTIVTYPNNTLYTYEQSQYWSAFQSSQQPRCRLTPTSAHEVSSALKTIGKYRVPFAVKGGGHGTFAGTSNVDDGIAIDLAGFTRISVAKDGKSVTFGTGNRWGELYGVLEKYGLAMVGGRVSGVGASGLILGGGISFFSHTKGWAADNIISFQVVLANGDIVNANRHENPSLWWALKGGSNNFGIVTAMTAKTFSQGPMFGGQRYYSVQQYQNKVIDGFVDVAHGLNTDGKGHTYVAWVRVNTTEIAVVALEYSQPVTTPPLFDAFDVVKMTPLQDTTRITSIQNLTLELQASSPNGLRQIFTTTTLGAPNAALLKQIIDTYYAAIDPIFFSIRSFLPALVISPISDGFLSASKSTGGNPLGLDPEEGPLTLVELGMTWLDEKDDVLVEAIAMNIRKSIEALGRHYHLSNKFIYQNYASRDQDVFTGYGKENKARLQDISKHYDPRGIFQRLQPGYFKVR